jgi:hypothetical protein
MWTEITRLKYGREKLRYASDTTDEEWSMIEPSPGATAGVGAGGAVWATAIAQVRRSARVIISVFIWNLRIGMAVKRSFFTAIGRSLYRRCIRTRYRVAFIVAECMAGDAMVESRTEWGAATGAVYGVGSCWRPSPIGFVWICG